MRFQNASLPPRPQRSVLRVDYLWIMLAIV